MFKALLSLLTEAPKVKARLRRSSGAALQPGLWVSSPQRQMNHNHQRHGRLQLLVGHLYAASPAPLGMGTRRWSIEFLTWSVQPSVLYLKLKLYWTFFSTILNQSALLSLKPSEKSSRFTIRCPKCWVLVQTLFLPLNLSFSLVICS